jgi:hypothetical protein
MLFKIFRHGIYGFAKKTFIYGTRKIQICAVKDHLNAHKRERHTLPYTMYGNEEEEEEDENDSSN